MQTPDAVLGDIRTSLIAPGVLLTAMRGHISWALAQDREKLFVQTLMKTRDPVWVMDLLEISSFEPSAIKVGSEWFSKFRKHDGRKLFFVSQLPAARMAAATLGFAIGLPVLMFDTLNLALAKLGLPRTVTAP